MSEAGDDIQVDAPAAEVEVTPDTAPKGKISLEDALQVLAHSSCLLDYILTFTFYSKF
jgi:small subunit ribosomal protein S12e